MSRRSAPIDGDALMRAINPSTEPPSSEALVEAALQRLLGGIGAASCHDWHAASAGVRLSAQTASRWPAGLLVAAAVASLLRRSTCRPDPARHRWCR